MDDKLVDYVIKEVFKRVMNKEKMKKYIQRTETGYVVRFEVDETFKIEELKESILKTALAQQGISLEEFDNFKQAPAK